MIGTGRLWIDSDGNRFAALASQPIMVNRNSSYDINERGILGPVALLNTSQFLLLTVAKIFSSVFAGFCSVILGVACLIPILTLV